MSASDNGRPPWIGDPPQWSTEPIIDPPPRPDPNTGEPFPPHGLGYRGRDDDPHTHPDREKRLSRKPKPPPGMGPTLAWYRPSTVGRAKIGFGSLGFLIVGLCITQAAGGANPFLWMTFWQMWLILMVGAILMGSPFTVMVHSAGADWLKVDRIRLGVFHKSNFVKTYELTKIDAAYGGPNIHLILHDGERSLERSFEELQTDRRVWDLLYNGIWHSAVNGAKVTKQAVGTLELAFLPGVVAANPLKPPPKTISDKRLRRKQFFKFLRR